MGTIIATIHLKCPKTGADVKLHKDCLNCPEYKHWGVQGTKIYVACKLAWTNEMRRRT